MGNELEPVVAGSCRLRVNDFLANLDEIAVLWPDVERSGFQPRNVQQIVDKPGHAIDMTGDRIQPNHMVSMAAFAIEILRHELDKPTNRGQWRSELMRDDRDKFVFDPARFLQRR